MGKKYPSGIISAKLQNLMSWVSIGWFY